MSATQIAQLIYPECEKQQLAAVSVLMQAWADKFAETPDLRKLADQFVADGFYPYYFQQKIKLLFVGRESLGMSGLDYISELFNAYKNNRIGNCHINQPGCSFHNRLMYVAYGLLNGMPEWQTIDYADKLTPRFGEKDGFSFAFMNISKLSNESANWQANWRLINAAVKASTHERNFIQEEVALLEPDVVIAMHLDKAHLDSIGSSKLLEENQNISAYALKTANRLTLLLNTWHFSAPNKKDISEIYLPICEMVRKWNGVLPSA